MRWLQVLWRVSSAASGCILWRFQRTHCQKRATQAWAEESHHLDHLLLAGHKDKEDVPVLVRLYYVCRSLSLSLPSALNPCPYVRETRAMVYVDACGSLLDTQPTFVDWCAAWSWIVSTCLVAATILVVTANEAMSFHRFPPRAVQGTWPLEGWKTTLRGTKQMVLHWCADSLTCIETKQLTFPLVPHWSQQDIGRLEIIALTNVNLTYTYHRRLQFKDMLKVVPSNYAS